jgi:glycosyltransferase 2 family protein
MTRRPVSARALLIAVGKAVITLSAIAIIVSQVDFAFLLSHWHKLSTLTLITSLALLAVQTSLIAGLRLKLVLEALGRPRRLGETFRVALSGFFFEQVALGFVGGDAMRLWLLHRADMSFRTALQAIVIDRCFGSVGLFLLALVGLPGLIGLLTGYDWRVIVAAGFAAALVGGAIVTLLIVRFAKRSRTPFVAEMVELASTAIRNAMVRRCLLMAFALATATHFMNVFVFFLVGRDLAMGLSIGHWFLVVPPVLLISMLPISAGGWGIREASFVVALASFGIRPEEAIIPPIIFGLGVLAVTLPGGIIWLANRRLAADTADTAAAGQVPTGARADGEGVGSAAEQEAGYRRELMRLVPPI